MFTLIFNVFYIRSYVRSYTNVHTYLHLHNSQNYLYMILYSFITHTYLHMHIHIYTLIYHCYSYVCLYNFFCEFLTFTILSRIFFFARFVIDWKICGSWNIKRRIKQKEVLINFFFFLLNASSHPINSWLCNFNYFGKNIYFLQFFLALYLFRS